MSERIKLSLQRRLSAVDANALQITYREAAAAFPSPEPHSSYFNLQTVEHSELILWADRLGWKVQPIRSLDPEVSADTPDVYFYKPE